MHASQEGDEPGSHTQRVLRFSDVPDLCTRNTKHSAINTSFLVCEGGKEEKTFDTCPVPASQVKDQVTHTTVLHLFLI